MESFQNQSTETNLEYFQYNSQNTIAKNKNENKKPSLGGVNCDFNDANIYLSSEKFNDKIPETSKDYFIKNGNFYYLRYKYYNLINWN